jgi:ATP-dependent DNA helicase RecG
VTALELLESLNLLDENEHIEAKRASEAGKSILESICAFANEPGLGGGWLLLGVGREEQALFPAYEVEGIDQPDKLGAEIATRAAPHSTNPCEWTSAPKRWTAKPCWWCMYPRRSRKTNLYFSKRWAYPRVLCGASAAQTSIAPMTI